MVMIRLPTDDDGDHHYDGDLEDHHNDDNNNHDLDHGGDDDENPHRKSASRVKKNTCLPYSCQGEAFAATAKGPW